MTNLMNKNVPCVIAGLGSPGTRLKSHVYAIFRHVFLESRTGSSGKPIGIAQDKVIPENVKRFHTANPYLPNVVVECNILYRIGRGKEVRIDDSRHLL